MRLVVGLGNPGSGYAKNRHNVGFMAVDDFVRRHGFGPWRAKFQGQVSEGSIGGDKVLVLKPETYMNLSGQSVGAALRFHKLTLDDVIVLHDELDLPAGRIRVKKGGGAGGHNGLKSIDAHLGKDYWRLRIGIGHPGDKDRVTGHVLSDFAKADAAWLDPLLDAVADHLPLLIAGQDSQFVNKVTVALAPPKAAVALAPPKVTVATAPPKPAKPPAKPKDPAEPKDGI